MLSVIQASSFSSLFVVLIRHAIGSCYKTPNFKVIMKDGVFALLECEAAQIASHGSFWTACRSHLQGSRCPGRTQGILRYAVIWGVVWAVTGSQSK